MNTSTLNLYVNLYANARIRLATVNRAQAFAKRHSHVVGSASLDYWAESKRDCFASLNRYRLAVKREIKAVSASLKGAQA